MPHEPKFDYDNIVCIRANTSMSHRCGAQAWVVGVTTVNERKGTYYDAFPPGTIYTIEFVDGTSIDVHEEELELFKNSIGKL